MSAIPVSIEGAWGEEELPTHWVFMGMMMHELGEKAPDFLKVGGMIYRRYTLHRIREEAKDGEKIRG